MPSDGVCVFCGQGCVSTHSTYCWLSSSLGHFSHVSADDFLEPEEYVEEPEGVMPEEAADLGMSGWGAAGGENVAPELWQLMLGPF